MLYKILVMTRAQMNTRPAFTAQKVRFWDIRLKRRQDHVLEATIRTFRAYLSPPRTVRPWGAAPESVRCSTKDQTVMKEQYSYSCKQSTPWIMEMWQRLTSTESIANLICNLWYSALKHTRRIQRRWESNRREVAGRSTLTEGVPVPALIRNTTLFYFTLAHRVL